MERKLKVNVLERRCGLRFDSLDSDLTVKLKKIYNWFECFYLEYESRSIRIAKSDNREQKYD